MKKTFTTAFLTLATAFGFAQDAIPAAAPNFTEAKLPALEEKVTTKSSFGYLRMGVSDSQLPTMDSVQVLPGFGLGYRLISGASAIDLSASFNRREIRSDEGSKESTYVYTLPKANYLYYISPARNNSFYAGAGLAWGGMKTKEATEFHGLVPNVAVGYEMNRKATLRSFVQIDVSQAAIAGIQKGALPKPYAELSLGAGF